MSSDIVMVIRRVMLFDIVMIIRRVMLSDLL